MCLQVDDNIPLRVMLLLMDEVFDLKEKNQWLRRNIKNLLQQLIRATYGDTINRSENRNLHAEHCCCCITLNYSKLNQMLQNILAAGLFPPSGFS